MYKPTTMASSKVQARVYNMLTWLLFMTESIAFCILGLFGVNFGYLLPYTTRFLIDTAQLDMTKLLRLERKEICLHVIMNGLASLVCLGGLGLGVFGKYQPHDIFPHETIVYRIILSRSDASCCICLDTFQLERDDVNRLPCQHTFHTSCVKKWQKINNVCPICRGCIYGRK